ncbi:MAG TPA: hypothetical protein VJU84_15430 [Pyrinomonadaceae bacterium]|nr:hypothetical protein [Pyrinomonadaceae bacterium]
MSTHDVRQPVKENQTRQVRDLPGCIKYILLLFLILLFLAELYAGEFRRFPDLPLIIWIVLLIKLILIALLIWLIKVQRTLNCAITVPAAGECATEEIDAVQGIQYIRVKGTASGSVFGHYTLAISGPYPYNVIYPPGGGSIAVTNNDLGRIDTTALDNGDYTITLTVFPIGAGAPHTCSVSFTLLKIAVYITRAAGVPAVPNWYDETAELVSGMHKVSIGGGIHLDGAAFVYTCLDRKIERYEVRYARVLGATPEPLQPATDAAIPATWPAGDLLHPPLVYDATKYWPWTKVGPAPMNLLNNWITQHYGAPSPGGTDYPCLSPAGWNSFAVSADPERRGGRYSLLLIVTDTQGHRYYDVQHIWLDNWPVQCKIVKFQKPSNGGWVDIPPCTDILLSWKKLRIVGIAWDSLIDKDWGIPGPPPNDNFEGYAMGYRKQFVPGGVTIITATTRVPSPMTFGGPTFLPTDADADVLADWDLTTLDAGPSPTGKCDAPLPGGHEHELYRGCSCTYILALGVNDKTVEEGSTSVHHPSIDLPIKLVNDL